jgi:hypothetical protein
LQKHRTNRRRINKSKKKKTEWKQNGEDANSKGKCILTN